MDLVSRVRVCGPLAEHAAGFAAYLAGAGYSPLSAANQVRLLAHLSRWMQGRGLAPGELTGQRAEEFLAVRRAAGYTSLLSARGLVPLLGFLRGLGVVPGRERRVPVAAVDVLLDRYGGYLARERALVASTVRYYLDEAREFLAGREDRLAGLTAGEVSGFVAAQCRRRSTGSAKILVTALRSLLRFLVLEGLVTPGLQDAVPSVAGWRGGGLPKALPEGQVAALLASCDRETATGRRDFAVLVLLSRLGLRACEAAALELDDIGWRAGTVTVRGKGRRDEQLPLPSDAGEALACYLRDGRPAGGVSRRVFLMSCAPGGGLSAEAVKAIVRRACRRAGIAGAGAHRLRHSAATRMLRAGAPLAEIGQVLPSSHAPPSLPLTDAAARCAAHRARTPTAHSASSAELPSSTIRSARDMCTRALTGCPARSGSSPPAIRRLIASASASWYRWAWVRVSCAPAGADSASSTAPTTAAHAGVRSPPSTPAPPNVVSSRTARSSNARPGFSSGTSGRDRSYNSAASPARSRRSIPARAAVTRIASAAGRHSRGSLSVQPQIARPNDSDISRSASAATTCGCAASRRAHAIWPTAAPLVTPVLCISQARGL
jgi:integrase/recombinase XerD